MSAALEPVDECDQELSDAALDRAIVLLLRAERSPVEAQRDQAVKAAGS